MASSSSSSPAILPIRFNKENVIKTKSIVGRGQFAISYMLGKIELDTAANTLKNRHPHINSPVLFKSVSMNDEERCFKALVRELNILENLRGHPHILNLVGACTNELKNREIFLAFEFCGHGNLLKFLRHCNPCADFETFRHIVTHTDAGSVLTLTRYRLLQWSYEIASGMEYLALNNICHNDLAARNILVTNDWKTKICNFALAQKLQGRTSPSHNLQTIVLPLKWMSPEAIKTNTFSDKSDVWSYGVTLWEIYSVGEVPYRGLVVDQDFWKTLFQGLRLSKPRYATADVWTIMYSCWDFKPESRPNFSEITSLLKKGLIIGNKNTKNETQNRSANMNTLRIN